MNQTTLKGNLMTVKLTAAEFLSIQVSNLSSLQVGEGKNLHATSVRIPHTVNAAVEAISSLSEQSRNHVMCLLLQAGIESFIEEIKGTDVHEAFLKLRDGFLSKPEKG